MNASMICDLSIEIEKPNQNFEDVIARSQRGDAEAFSVIFAQYHRFIYKFIYAMVGDQSAAEELTQETFLAAYKGINLLRGEAQLQTWLCAIAKNTVYKSLRSLRKQGTRSEDEIENLYLIDEQNPLPDKLFLGKELSQAIQTALGKLDEDKRMIFTLKELQHLSYKEIAEITGYSIPKLKTDLHRAKAEMRNVLRPYLEVRQ